MGVAARRLLRGLDGDMKVGLDVAQFATIVAPFAPVPGVSCGFSRALGLAQGEPRTDDPKETTPCTIPA
jgi:hypothetical protein